jgi:hypothetical protein
MSNIIAFPLVGKLTNPERCEAAERLVRALARVYDLSEYAEDDWRYAASCLCEEIQADIWSGINALRRSATSEAPWQK